MIRSQHPVHSTPKIPKSLNDLPTLDELLPGLQIEPVNTGKVLNFGGIISDNDEGLNAVTNCQGKLEISSGVEMPSYMYRGQTEEYIPCLPSLGRIKNVSHKLLSLGRNIAFEEAIGSHPFVKKAENTKFLNCFLYVDRKGLAQHYGKATDLIDVTSNFDVATFFAVCRWDSQTQTYLPVRSASKPGVLYRILSAILMNASFSDKKKEEIFNYVRWQPLNRPEQQRACGVRLTKGQDFAKLSSVQMVHFRHSAEISERIWNSFDQGRALFPEDPAADQAKKALELNCFTRYQLDLAWSRLESWEGRTYDADQRRLIEQQLKIQLLDKPVLSWDGLNVERDDQILQKKLDIVLNRVRYRLATYPEKSKLKI